MKEKKYGSEVLGDSRTSCRDKSDRCKVHEWSVPDGINYRI